MKEGMTFLPDEREIDFSRGVGISTAPISAMKALAAARPQPVDEPLWRGLIALCLLLDAWQTDAQIAIKTIQPRTSFASAALAEPIRLVLLTQNERCHVLGILDANMGLRPAAQLDDMTLPACITWHDGAFHDPTEQLCEQDRNLLISRLSTLNQQGDPMVQRFLSALTQAGMRSAQSVTQQDEAALSTLAIRMRAILGQAPGVDMRKTEHIRSINPLLHALELTQRDERSAPAITWLYQGVPFARSCAALLAEDTGHPQEQQTLAALSRDMLLLERYSPTWQTKLARNLQSWLGRKHESALLPFVTTMAEAILQQAALPAPTEPLRLTWPWRTGGVEQALWHEALSDKLDAGLAAPFADRLCILEGGAYTAFGHDGWSRMCVMQEHAVVPPISRQLAAIMGDHLLPESFRFQQAEDGSVLASFALAGTSPVILERRYAKDELRTLPVESAPTLALWPGVPLPQESWKAYYTYVHGGAVGVAVFTGHQWLPAEDRLFSVMKTETYPQLLALHEDGRELGVILNRQPAPRPLFSDPTLALMEVGASGVTLALSQSGQPEPLRLPDMLRVILHGGAVSLADEFLPAAPLGPTLPAAVELFGPGDAPLTDGHILMPETCSALARHDAKNLYSAWKWSVDENARRARRLMLRQAMLLASLAAAQKGAAGIAWRIALPEGMGAEGRRLLWQEVTALAPQVAADCGLPLTDRTVTHADESMALGAYLRGDGGVRGGFLALDVGSGDVSLALWLRGMNRPAVRCNLPLGVQSMLLDGLLQAPQAIEADFADMPDGPARQTVLLLGQMLQSAAGRKAVEHCRFLLDQCLCDHGTELSAHMNRRFAQGSMTTTQALIFQGYAAMLAISGLVQEQVARDPLLNDYLPGELTFLMAGRGSQLMAAMPDQLKSALVQFVRLEMSPTHPVRQTNYLFTGPMKCETVLGLAHVVQNRGEAPAAPQSLRASGPLPMPPEAWVQRWLSAFRTVFPAAAQLIYGETVEFGRIRAAVARCFAEAEPEAALAACLTEMRQV